MRTADWERREAQRAQIIPAAIAAIERGSIAAAPRLSRRHRWDLLDLDVRGDRAAVAAAIRGKRSGLTIEVHCLRCDRGTWTWDKLGPSHEENRPALPTRWPTEGATFASYSTRTDVKEHVEIGLWHLVAQAAWLTGEHGLRPVAEHGWVVTIRDERTPPLDVLDGDEHVLGALKASLMPSPLRDRVARWRPRAAARRFLVWSCYGQPVELRRCPCGRRRKATGSRRRRGLPSG